MENNMYYYKINFIDEDACFYLYKKGEWKSFKYPEIHPTPQDIIIGNSAGAGFIWKIVSYFGGFLFEYRLNRAKKAMSKLCIKKQKRDEFFKGLQEKYEE